MLLFPLLIMVCLNGNFTDLLVGSDVDVGSIQERHEKELANVEEQMRAEMEDIVIRHESEMAEKEAQFDQVRVSEFFWFSMTNTAVKRNEILQSVKTP